MRNGLQRKRLFEEGKELTHLRDELSRQRLELPWEKVEKHYVFEDPSGKVALADLFRGKSQLIIYHFMFGPDWQEGCPSCSLLGDHFDGSIPHLQEARRDAGRGISRADGQDRGVQKAHGLEISVGLFARQRFQLRLPRLVHQRPDG